MPFPITEEDFFSACRSVHGGDGGGIGTLSEKTVHAVLKHCCSPCAEGREVQIGGYIADAVGADGIAEVQTRGFYQIREKLAAFLSVCPVTVVWPCVETLWLRRLDPATGEAGKRRKSPRRQSPEELFFELMGLGELLAEPGLSFKVVRLEAEELRSAEKEPGRKGHWPAYRKIDRYPVGFYGEIDICGAGELWKLLPALPDPLPGRVTAAEFAALSGTGREVARAALRTFCFAGMAAEDGLDGRQKVYRFIR